MKGSETRRKWRAAGIALAFLMLCVLACSLLGAPILRLVSDPESFRRWVDGHGFWGRLAYMGMVILQICAAFIPGEPLEIAGGFAFGAVEGTLLCLAASAIGSGAVILFGTPLWQAAGRAVLFKGKTGLSGIPPVIAKKAAAVFNYIYNSRNAKGSSVLLCGADGYKAFPASADLLCGTHPLGNQLHPGRGCAGDTKLSLRCHCVPRSSCAQRCGTFHV